jgi:PmbA protein
MMEISESLGGAEFVVEKARELGADDCIATVTNSLARQIKFVNNEIATTQSWDTVNTSIFLSKDRRIIASSLQEMDRAKIANTIKSLLSVATKMKPKDDYHGIARGPFQYRDIPETYDPKVASLSEGGVDIVSSAVSRALEAGVKRCSGVMLWNTAESFKVTSGGVRASEKGTDIQFSMRALVDKERSGHMVRACRTMKCLEPERTAQEAADTAVKAKAPVDGKVGRYDILFHPMAFANLMSYTANSFSAFYVDSGFSFLGDMIGKKVAADMVSITDDGTMPNGYWSTKYDEEGHPVKPNPLIKDGVLQTYLHNTSTAASHKTKSTGNAGLTSPYTWNVSVGAGDMAVDDMISSIKDGLYVTNLWYTRFSNYRTGDFSTIPRDAIFRVKDGKIVGNWKSIRISDNMLNILKNVSALSKERNHIYWWETSCPVTTPYVLVKGVNVTKPQ